MTPKYNPNEDTYNELMTVKASGGGKLQSLCNVNNEEFTISLRKIARSGFIGKFLVHIVVILEENT